jgi:hypothetical protein
MKLEVGPLPCKTLPTSLMTLELRSLRLLGRCSHQLLKNCARVNMVYSRAERVFILEYYFASKCCCSWIISQCVSWQGSTELDNNTQTCNKISGHRKVFFCGKRLSCDKIVEITAVPISSNASAGYGCKNSILPLVSLFCAWRSSCVAVRVAF